MLDLNDVRRIPIHGGSLRIYARRAEDETKPVGPRVVALRDVVDPRLVEELAAGGDVAASSAWTHLGLEGTVRLGELMRPITKAVVASGVLPAGLGAPRR